MLGPIMAQAGSGPGKLQADVLRWRHYAQTKVGLAWPCARYCLTARSGSAGFSHMPESIHCTCLREWRGERARRLHQSYKLAKCKECASHLSLGGPVLGRDGPQREFLCFPEPHKPYSQCATHLSKSISRGYSLIHVDHLHLSESSKQTVQPRRRASDCG